MPLVPGEHLGPYKILSLIGEGGMGQVWKARDTRLDRCVAIKTAHQQFNERFHREAKAIAALNHSNICQLYDVGPDYLVMEYVEGSTLSDRIAQGSLHADEALAIAKQIADALEAAHEKGITHRDLKPANIKVRQDGMVKVLDFGLAKAVEQPAADPLNTPTVVHATIAGSIVGTPAYMSPEQARGWTVDKRTDIWAFGVVLYEMLTSRRPFEGESVTDVMSAVVGKDPDFLALPVKARRLVQRCLEKEPKNRLRDIGDACSLLEDPAERSIPVTQWKVAAGLLFVALVSVVLAVSLWAQWRPTIQPAAHTSTRIEVDLGLGVSLASITGSAVIVSPDGTRLVFVSQNLEGTRQLFTRRLDQAKAVPLPGTWDAYAPFFSPDSQWVAFFAQGKLKKTRIDGGEPISLCDAPASRGGSWGEDGNIIAALDQQSGLTRIPPEGGKGVSITTLNLKAGETTHRWPQVLPGGKAVLFISSTAYGNYGNADIEVVTLKDQRRKVLLAHAGMYPRYLTSGHLIYITRGTLFAVPFDTERLEVRGSATRLWEMVNNPNLGFGEIDFSSNGILAYRAGGTEGLRTLQWLDRSGKTVSIALEPGIYSYPHLSPDGSRLVYVSINPESGQDLWTYDFERGTKARLTNGQTLSWPLWSADGRFIIYQALGGMFWVRADGAGKPQPLIKAGAIQLPNSITRDGKWLAYSEQGIEGETEIRIVPLEASSTELRAGEPRVFTKTATGTAFAAFSPNGRWLAYANAEGGGQYEIYVRSFPDNGTQVLVSNAGGIQPAWSQDGHELFYRTTDQRLMMVTYSVQGGTFVPGKPQPRFGLRLANIGLGTNFDLTPDSKRMIVLVPVENQQARENQGRVVLIMNFFDELRRLGAAK